MHVQHISLCQRIKKWLKKKKRKPGKLDKVLLNILLYIYGNEKLKLKINF